MQLTMYTDYSLRVLIYLALTNGEKTTISEIAESYGVSKNHLFLTHSRGTIPLAGGGPRLTDGPVAVLSVHFYTNLGGHL